MAKDWLWSVRNWWSISKQFNQQQTQFMLPNLLRCDKWLLKLKSLYFSLMKIYLFKQHGNSKRGKKMEKWKQELLKIPVCSHLHIHTLIAKWYNSHTQRLFGLSNTSGKTCNIFKSLGQQVDTIKIYIMYTHSQTNIYAQYKWNRI